MKNTTKRAIAAGLIIALFISLLSGIAIAVNGASVDYVTGNVSGFGTVIRNWGTRGTTATFLSQNAEAFYENNNVTYSALAALSGSSNTSSVPSSALYNELQDLMADNHDVITSYDETKRLYPYTDCQNSCKDSTAISSFYSGTPIGPSWDGTWNREHTWPNSKGEGSAENDIMMLRPTATSENSSRGNTAYGESSSYYDPNEVSNGKYNLHGDVARIMLYVYVRWGNTTNMWGSSGVMESKDVLLKWMEEDPVDTWELGRNDSVESITGTRNVFVDYPELAFELFNADVPADMPTPSGEAAGGTSAYTITAVSSNAAHGTVSVNGTKVTGFPAQGYYVSGYTLVSGSATVTASGNIFTVAATSDCTIRVDFAARTAVTATFREDGTTASVQNVYSGDMIQLPDHSGSVAEGYNFMGWVTSPVAETEDTPATIYKTGADYILNTTTTFYALYTRTAEDGAGSSSIFYPYTGAIEEGDYLIVYDSCAMKSTAGQGTRIGFDSITVTDSVIYSPADALIWHISPTGDGYFTIYNESASVYAGGTGTKSQATFLTSVTDYAKWTLSLDDTNSAYNIVNLGNSNKNVNAVLRKNANYGFACYHENFESGLLLYKRGGGTVYYTTSTGTDVPGTDVPGTDIPGDFTKDGNVDTADVVYLLWHTLYAEDYPITINGDFTNDGNVDTADVVYLLWHTLYAEDYPL